MIGLLGMRRAAADDDVSGCDSSVASVRGATVLSECPFARVLAANKLRARESARVGGAT
jgi:hypothetical protein